MRSSVRRIRQRRALSYFEVCLATAILALCIIPAMQALPGLMVSQRTLETACQLSVMAQQKLEAAVFDLGADFAERDEEGDLTSEGHSDWRYHVVVTVPAAGSGRYAVLRAEVWVDADADGLLDPTEPQARLDTLVADLYWSP